MLGVHQALLSTQLLFGLVDCVKALAASGFVK